MPGLPGSPAEPIWHASRFALLLPPFTDHSVHCSPWAIGHSGQGAARTMTRVCTQTPRKPTRRKRGRPARWLAAIGEPNRTFTAFGGCRVSPRGLECTPCRHPCWPETSQGGLYQPAKVARRHRVRFFSPDLTLRPCLRHQEPGSEFIVALPHGPEACVSLNISGRYRPRGRRRTCALVG